LCIPLVVVVAQAAALQVAALRAVGRRTAALAARQTVALAARQTVADYQTAAALQTVAGYHTAVARLVVGLQVVVEGLLWW